MGRRDFFFFVPDLLLSILTPLFLPSSSFSLSYFILAVPMRKCLGNHSCMSSPFLVAILNSTFLFHSVKTKNNWKRSAIKQILQNYSFPSQPKQHVTPRAAIQCNSDMNAFLHTSGTVKCAQLNFYSKENCVRKRS